MYKQEEWKRVRDDNESVRQVQVRREQKSLQRRENEMAKRQRLHAEIAALDISHRVMKPKQLARYREEIRLRIGVAIPAETQKSW